MTNWYDVGSDAAQARLIGAWPEAPLTSLEVCEMLLDIARQQVLTYGDELGEPLEQLAEDLASLGYPTVTIAEVLAILDAPEFTGPPIRYVYAQLQQAINLWNAGRVSSDGTVGDGWSFTPRPLDKTIRGIIRPIDGKPHVL